MIYGVKIFVACPVRLFTLFPSPFTLHYSLFSLHVSLVTFWL